MVNGVFIDLQGLGLYVERLGVEGEMKKFYSLVAITSLAVFAGHAGAHEEVSGGGGLVSGLAHPILGWDHVAAMVAVGLWGAFLGNPSIWLLPVIFPLVMALGGVLGVAGFPLPAVETGIAISALVLGMMVVFSVQLNVLLAALMVGCFAVFHGYAHGTELPGAVDPLAYSIGFVISTGLLHLSGVVFGLLERWAVGRVVIKVGGGLVAMVGVGVLSGIV